MEKQGILDAVGIPKEFGVALLLISLILLLAPYLAGQDLGVIKIPAFSPSAKRALRLFGPVAMLAAVLLHVPLVHKGDSQAITPSQTPVPRYKTGAVNFWRIGSPHSGDTPGAELPLDIKLLADRLNIDVSVRSLPAKDFAKTLFAAIEAHEEPDVIAIDNYGLIEGIKTDLGVFTGIESSDKVRDALVRVVGAFASLSRGWQFLLSSSPNHRLARRLVLEEVPCLSESPQDITTLPQGPLDAFRLDAVSAAQAHLACETDRLKRISDDSRLGLGCIGRGQPVFVGKVRACGVYGNRRLSFAELPASVSSERSLGHIRLLAVFRKTEDSWKLLTITGDRVAVSLLEGPVQTLARKLVESDILKGEAPKAATPVTADWTVPQPEAGERFGFFVWRPSRSDKLLAEILEFEYGYATRLFIFFRSAEPKLSAGQLMHADQTWRWRVWSVIDDGRLAFSEQRSFKQ